MLTPKIIFPDIWSVSAYTVTFVIHFVDKACNIREEFILCDDGVSGAALSTKLLSTLSEYGLDPNYIRGQRYDGAGNMAGKCRGAAACILQKQCMFIVHLIL